ncbi:MAG: hypothetical protein QXO66_01175 [Thermofilum sp.]
MTRGARVMIDALVMTLGFEPGPLISTIASAASEGFSERAQILVFTSAFPDERADRAWLELQRIVNMMDFAKRLGLQPDGSDSSAPRRRQAELSLP